MEVFSALHRRHSLSFPCTHNPLHTLSITFVSYTATNPNAPFPSHAPALHPPPPSLRPILYLSFPTPIPGHHPLPATRGSSFIPHPRGGQIHALSPSSFRSFVLPEISPFRPESSSVACLPIEATQRYPLTRMQRRADSYEH